jgi:hypothetical protein
MTGFDIFLMIGGCFGLLILACVTIREGMPVLSAINLFFIFLFYTLLLVDLMEHRYQLKPGVEPIERRKNSGP